MDKRGAIHLFGFRPASGRRRRAVGGARRPVNRAMAAWPAG